jgi:putative SOS response-associated peptidase YedK
MPCRSIIFTKKTATGEQLYAVAPADRGLRTLAGLWENWRSPAGGWMRSFAIITTKPQRAVPGTAQSHAGGARV